MRPMTAAAPLQKINLKGRVVVRRDQVAGTIAHQSLADLGELARSQTFSNASSDPFFTRKRFMAMNILLSFLMHRPTRGPTRVCTKGPAF
jgi:hypothetical protein